jgi:hypothetical protein
MLQTHTQRGIAPIACAIVVHTVCVWYQGVDGEYSSEIVLESRKARDCKKCCTVVAASVVVSQSKRSHAGRQADTDACICLYMSVHV